MRLLLDTHIAIWAVLGSDQLAASMKVAIAAPENDVAVSIVSLWEIAVKNNRRIGDGMGLSVQVADEEFARASFRLMPVEPRHATAVETLPLLHRDPFDRMLVAQAAVDGFRLVTHDRALADYGEHVLLV